jgi:acetate kinase
LNAILVLNAGSSSLKFQVFRLEGGLASRLRGRVAAIGTKPYFTVEDEKGAAVAARELHGSEGRDHAACLEFLASWLSRGEAGRLDLVAVGHRVAHGGVEFTRPLRVDATVLARLEKLSPLAPLHQPYNLAPIRQLLRSAPQVPQIACFDTAFHATQPTLAKLYGLPKRFFDEGVLRYGFHGLSYEYVARKFAELAPELASLRVVVAHLGSGASMCAMQGGKSVATTFGFTALEGLPMGTRSGALDPGIILYLARERGLSLDEIERLLYQQSGLLGLSGVSNDVPTLLASREPDAALALDYLAYRVARELGSLAAALSGLDALVFTAGIGENSAEMRARIVERCAWLGLELDPQANGRSHPLISSATSRVAAWVIPTNEELVIAEHTLALLKGEAA